jgi:hypothetical protein
MQNRIERVWKNCIHFSTVVLNKVDLFVVFWTEVTWERCFRSLNIKYMHSSLGRICLLSNIGIQRNLRCHLLGFRLNTPVCGF